MAYASPCYTLLARVHDALLLQVLLRNCLSVSVPLLVAVEYIGGTSWVSCYRGRQVVLPTLFGGYPVKPFRNCAASIRSPVSRQAYRADLLVLPLSRFGS